MWKVEEEVGGGGRVGGNAKADAKTKQLEEGTDGSGKECQESKHFSFNSQCKQQTQTVGRSAYSWRLVGLGASLVVVQS